MPSLHTLELTSPVHTLPTQVVISPRNYFLFTPLLPSVTVGTLAARSILEPTRFLTRHMKRKTEVYEGEVYEVDPHKKTVRFVGASVSLLRCVRFPSLRLLARRVTGEWCTAARVVR